MGMPCLIRPVAGLGNLAALTGQPAPAPAHLADQIRARAEAPPEAGKAAYEALARFDSAYFARAWTSLLSGVGSVTQPTAP